MSSATTNLPPLTPEQQLASVARVSQLAKETMFLPEARRGNDNTLWRTLAGGIRMLSRRYGMSDLPIGHFEIEIRNTWDCFVIGASYIDADHPAQDRLVRGVLVAREYGVLTRRRRTRGEGEGEGEEEVAVTEDGMIWNDLPFLVDVLRRDWRVAMGGERDGEEGVWERRVNLTAAIARLASVGVKAEELGQCGLVIMAMALEREGRVDKDMLRLVDVWLRFAGDCLLRLSLGGTRADGTWAEGLLGAEALGEGFSRDRFLGWKDRLGELKKAVVDREADAVEVGCANMIGSAWDSFHGLR
ncbi:hypothetical protein CONLIGDRAFT_643137 [Coniochaeta ligniaria NRRL 30616]|uniref:Uncharacterized protein n=1 Tax=Coniochaeta ligniaria NRRL 30616 TaxID=1408157 RepID=A0A1J7JCQ7_9PEZI|nr:hypothetical protein CONLIGDRAFT_643137 [Coniochaeta ligniaria NRRL 30616]